MKKVTKTSTEYKTPRCKLVDVHINGLLCQSFGDANKAGNDLTESDEYTYDL